MADKTFISLLRRQLPAHCILSHPEDLRPYECDALSAYSKLPMVVVIPETLDQVQTLLKLSSDNNVPVVARGAGTGLSGGALPRSDGVLLSLARFNRILDIDTGKKMPVACTALNTGLPYTIYCDSKY
jgi:glycolate oxidase